MQTFAIALALVGLQDPGLQLLHGRVAAEGFGVIDGVIHLELWAGETMTRDKARVEASTWSLAVPPKTRVRFRTVILDHTPTRGHDLFPLEPDRRWVLPESGELVASFARPAPFLLEVVDAWTGAEIRNYTVEVRFTANLLPDQVLASPRSRAPQPGLRSLGKGRGRFICTSRPVSLFVSAPGFATQRIDLDPMLGGHLGVALEPGGELVLEIKDWRLVAPPGSFRGTPFFIRVWDNREVLVLERPVRSSLRFVGLRPGLYRVVLEGEWRENPIQYGEMRIAVPSGEVTQDVLQARPGTCRPVPLAGILNIPIPWDPAEWRLVLTAEHPQRVVELKIADLPRGPEGGRSFALEDAAPGSWLATIPNIAWAAVLEVGPEGGREFTLDVPPPQTLRVRVIEQGSDKRAQIRSLLWQGQMPKGDERAYRWDRSPSPVRRRPDAEGWATLQVPMGTVILSTSTFLHEPQSHGVEVGTEPMEVVLELVPRGGVRIRWADSKERPAPITAPMATFTREDGTPEPSGGGGRGLDWAVFSLPPGNYRVKFWKVEGCEPIEPIEVEVHARKLTELEVQLIPD
jgi:hypothetical protein